MTKSNHFKYYDNNFQVPNASDDVFVGVLPEGISDTVSLFDALDSILLLPGWWGQNWDALQDCLGDYHWLKEKTVVLVHKELPQLPADELQMYLDILSDSVISLRAWRNGEEHILIVWFPNSCRKRIARIFWKLCIKEALSDVWQQCKQLTHRIGKHN